MGRTSNPNRRQAERLDKAFPVFVSGNHGVSFGVARNISTGGMYVETHDTEPIGSRLLVTFAWPGSSAEMSVEAEVRYERVVSYEEGEVLRRVRGLGLEFLRFLPRDDFEAAAPTDPGAYH